MNDATEARTSTHRCADLEEIFITLVRT